jgi:hypothetical protein
MTASRLNHRGHVVPALTDHTKDEGGVIGLQSSHKQADSVNYCPRSSCASRFTVGAFGFLTFTQ